MTGTVSPQVPILNSPDSTEEPKVRSAIITLRDALNVVLTSANILDGAKLAAGTVATAALANLSVTAAKIGLGEVNALHLAADSVTTNAILDLNVTGAKIAGGTIGSGKLALTTLSDVLASDQNMTASMADICSVNVVSGGLYFVTATAILQPTSGALFNANACNPHLSLNYNGAEHETGSINFDAPYDLTLAEVITISSGTTIKLRGKDVGSRGSTAIGKNADNFGRTRLIAVRIG